MVPFESLCTVSYAHTIVTMAVCLAILEIFSVREWPDLETWVWGHSRSLKIVPFSRPCTNFCKSSYLTLHIITTLKCGLEVTQGHSNC